MKKIVAALLALLMLAVFAACGSKPAQTTTTTPSETKTETKAEEPKKEEAKPAIDYTKKTVTVIVPFAAGGGQHVLATAVQGCTPNVNMVITNVTGGGGAVGIMELLNSKNDGWTVGCSTLNNVAAGAFNGAYPDPDAYKKLTMVASVAGDRMIMIANKAFMEKNGFKTLEDVVNYSKNNPDNGFKVTGATANSYTQAVAELFMSKLGVKWAYVPYDGEQSARNAIMGGDCDLCIFGVGAAQSAISGGYCTGLCLLSPERSTFFPEVPTCGEIYAELKNFDHTVYRCYYMPENVDPAIVAEFEKILEGCAKSEEFKKTCDGLFLEITYMGSAEMQAKMDQMIIDCEEMYKIMNAGK